MTKNIGNSAFLILTDTFSESMLRLYLQIKAATDSFGETFIIYHDKNGKPDVRLQPYNTYTFTDAVLDNLGYTPVRRTLVPGSNHFPILQFHLEHPEFDYYWCIEDDVVFSGEWASFFNPIIKNISYDFISSYVKFYHEMINPDWFWWTSFSQLGEGFEMNDLVMSFNPIYSLSNRAATFLDKSLKQGWSGHHEVFIATVLHVNGFLIRDFGGERTFVPNGFRNKFYNDDTHLFRPPFTAAGKLLNKIYHPVKNRFKLNNDFKFKISFCITGKDLLYELQYTLEKNILDNQEYDNFEFVICNFVCEDLVPVLGEWILKYVNSGRVSYYKAVLPKKYSSSRAKNTVSKLANGDILCHMSASQLIGKEFAIGVNEQFKFDSNVVYVETKSKPQTQLNESYMGMVIMKKSDFLSVRGFDESLIDEGCDLFDLLSRLAMVRVKKMDFVKLSFSKSNMNMAKFPLEFSYLDLNRILVQHLDPASSMIIFVYRTGIFEMGTIINNVHKGHEDFRNAFIKGNTLSQFSLLESRWKSGKWFLADDSRNLIFEGDQVLPFQLQVVEEFYQNPDGMSNDSYFNLTDPDNMQTLINFNYQSKNSQFDKVPRSKFSRVINKSGFGKAIVFKEDNFGPLKVI